MRMFPGRLIVPVLMVIAAVSLAPASASAASSAVTVTTEHASGISGTTAVLHGVVGTGGQKVEWQFEYGTSATYGRATPLVTIAAGSGTKPVSAEIKHLKPNTLYHFRLVVVTSGPKRNDGRDLTFTTRGSGRLLLDHNALAVIGGRVSVTFTCASTIPCTGRFSIDTRARLKKSHKTASVVCATAPFSLAAKQRKSVTTTVRSACLSLLRHARHHRLVARITSSPRTGQEAVVRTVILEMR